MPPTGDFSHKVTVNPWPEDGLLIELEASAAEREALRARFELVDLTSLRASAKIEKKVMELVIAGKIEADVAQTCVVTLKPITSSLDVPFERRYRKREVEEKAVSAGDDMSDDAIDIEILESDEIDVGEVIAEEFFLALDPYPKSADADQALEEFRAKNQTEWPDQPAGPFEKLRRH